MRYPYKIDRDVTTVFLERKDGSVYEVYIDTEDITKLETVSSMYVLWQLGGTPRVAIRISSCGKKERSYIHRLIMDAPKDMLVDHIDNNPLNNCKSNLRLVDMSGNMQNRRGATQRSRSGIRGLYWDTSKNKWTARVHVNNQCVYFKRFDDLDEAIEAVQTARAKYQPLSKEATSLHGARC